MNEWLNEDFEVVLRERTCFQIATAVIGLSHRFIRKFCYLRSLIALTAEICMWNARLLSVPPSVYIATLLQVSPFYFSGIHLHKFHVTAGGVNIFYPICIAKLTAVTMVGNGDHPSVETVIIWPRLRPSY